MSLGRGVVAAWEGITLACRAPNFRVAVVPVIVNIVMGIFLLFLLWHGWPALNPAAPDAAEWTLWIWQTVRYWVVKIGLMAAFSFGMIVLSILLTEPLCGLLGVLDRLVLLQQKELAPDMQVATVSIGVSLLRAFQVLAVGLCIQFPALVLVGVSFFTGLIPVVGWIISSVLTAGSICLAGLAMAWNLLDYPFTLAGHGLRFRVRWLAGNLPAVLEVGIPLALLSFFLTPLVLPIGVIAVSRLFFRSCSETAA